MISEGILITLLTAPLWLRVFNEVACRTIRRAVVICPHCGIPAVVKSGRPEVFR